MKFFSTIALILFLFSLCLFAQESASNDSSAPPKLLILADAKVKNPSPEMNFGKIEAAFNLAAPLSKKYLLIPSAAVDSVAESISARGETPNLKAVAEELNADYALFVSAGSIGNLVRIDLKMSDFSRSESLSGYGTAVNRYVSEGGARALDPAILEAAQRALARAAGDSLLYADAEEGFRVFPTKTLAVGGLEFVGNEDLESWEIFDNKTVSSFFAVESMFESAREIDSYATLDQETRDSIYAAGGLYIPENFKPPTSTEVKILYNFGIDMYLTGKLIRVKDGAKIVLFLCRIEREGLVPIETDEDFLSEDDLDKFKEILQKSTKILLE